MKSGPIAAGRYHAKMSVMRKDKPKQSRYSVLLNEVCVGLGYCGSTRDGRHFHVDDFIPDAGMVTADQFAEWVVLADSLNPSTSSDLKAIRRAFIRHMGADSVDAKLLRWKRPGVDL